MTNAIEHKGPPELVLRWMEEGDLSDKTEFTNECAKLEEVVEETSLGEVTREFHHPLFTGRTILAYVDGKIIGEAGYNHQERANHTWAWMHVHPDYRLRGIGTAIFDTMEKHYAENQIPPATYVPNERATLLIQFLERRGFHIERYFWDMLLPAEVEVEKTVSMPPGASIRTFVRGQDEELFLRARNVSFAEHYGSVQRTLEEIVGITNEPDFRPEGLFFAFQDDDLAGFCLTAVHPDECERRGYGIGHVDLVGTMPEYRGKGIGRALLLTAVHYLRTRVPIVTLDVEGKNTNALTLYKNTGFHQHKGWANMIRNG